ncbi:hypothetical protein BG004_002419 [Podila humilis]|nr:hypothetical protein BG004_002419 [Podila humilis]
MHLDQIQMPFGKGHEAATRRRIGLIKNMETLSAKDPGQRVWNRIPIKPRDTCSAIDGTTSNDDEGHKLVQKESVPVYSQQAASLVPAESEIASSYSNSELEPNRDQLRYLQVPFQVLIGSPLTLEQYTLGDVKGAPFKGSNFSNFELDVIHSLANKLDPLYPSLAEPARRWLLPSSPHVVLRAPIVLLSSADL